ncbi:MAG: hypothetical protein V1663_01725 [archaeon]
MNRFKRILLTAGIVGTLASGYSFVRHYTLMENESKSPIRTEYSSLQSQYNQEKSLMFTISEIPDLKRDQRSIDSLLTTIDKMQELDRQIDSLENSDVFKQSNKREKNYAYYSVGSILLFCMLLAGIIPDEGGPL